MAEHLLLLRHGRIASARAGCMIGVTDLPLDPFGRAQARAMAERTKDWMPLRCYSSPLARCRETALALLPERAVRWDDDLREIDFGQWETRTFAEMAAERPELVEPWKALDPEFAFPGGEKLQSFLARVRRAADRLTRDDAPTVLAVTHGGVIRAMLCHLLGLDPRQYVAFDVGYAALAVVRLFDGRGVLTALERCPIVEAPGSAEGSHG